MGLEGVGFLWYTRRITPWAALGFIAGMGSQAEDTSASSMFQGSSGIPTTDSAFSIGLSRFGRNSVVDSSGWQKTKSKASSIRNETCSGTAAECNLQPKHGHPCSRAA